MTGLTVLIPAHDEGALIAQTVSRLTDADALRIVVVANGCTDDTAARARSAGSDVVEVAEASKIAAINAGLAHADEGFVAVVDADVTVSGRDLVELAARVEADVDAAVASPTMRVLPSRSWAVRQYYRVWELTDYRRRAHIGSGVYLLSAEGRRRLGTLPEVIADDLFVQRMFAPDERMTPPDLFFSVRAPETLRALLRRNTRIAAGNRQLAALFPELGGQGTGGGAGALARRVRRRPGLWAGFVIYCAVYLSAHRGARRILAAGRTVSWNRDETTRTVPQQ